METAAVQRRKWFREATRITKPHAQLGLHLTGDLDPYNFSWSRKASEFNPVRPRTTGEGGEGVLTSARRTPG